MSRIGQKLIEIPESIKVEIKQNTLLIKNERDQFEIELPGGLSAQQDGNKILIKRKNDRFKALHGLYRQLINNAVIGLKEGFVKKLLIKGVGFRAVVEDNNLILNVGFSHQVILKIPEGIEIKINKNIIEVLGIDKQRVGQFAAQIREVKKPEPYKGKGIMYIDEYVRRKPGKAAKTESGSGGA